MWVFLLFLILNNFINEYSIEWKFELYFNADVCINFIFHLEEMNVNIDWISLEMNFSISMKRNKSEWFEPVG